MFWNIFIWAIFVWVFLRIKSLCIVFNADTGLCLLSPQGGKDSIPWILGPSSNVPTLFCLPDDTCPFQSDCGLWLKIKRIVIVSSMRKSIAFKVFNGIIRFFVRQSASTVIWKFLRHLFLWHVWENDKASRNNCICPQLLLLWAPTGKQLRKQRSSGVSFAPQVPALTELWTSLDDLQPLETGWLLSGPLLPFSNLRVRLTSGAHPGLDCGHWVSSLWPYLCSRVLHTFRSSKVIYHHSYCWRQNI